MGEGSGKEALEGFEKRMRGESADCGGPWDCDAGGGKAGEGQRLSRYAGSAIRL